MSVLEAIRQEILTGTAVNEVIYGNQSAPRPNLPYATMTLITDRVRGIERSEPDDNGIQTLRARLRWTISIQIFGDDARARASALRLHLQRLDAMQRLTDEGVSVNDDEDIQDLSQLRDREYEISVGYDIHCQLTERASEDVGLVETVLIERD